jgi:hypothetical protein
MDPALDLVTAIAHNEYEAMTEVLDLSQNLTAGS